MMNCDMFSRNYKKCHYWELYLVLSGSCFHVSAQPSGAELILNEQTVWLLRRRKASLVCCFKPDSLHVLHVMCVCVNVDCVSLWYTEELFLQCTWSVCTVLHRAVDEEGQCQPWTWGCGQWSVTDMLHESVGWLLSVFMNVCNWAKNSQYAALLAEQKSLL